MTACMGIVYKNFFVTGIFLGSLWGCFNLYLIEMTVKAWLIERHTVLLAGLFLVKFPLLYWVGYQLLLYTKVDPWWTVGGLSIVFFVAAFRTAIPMRKRCS